MSSKLDYNFVYFCSAYNDVSHILALIEREPQSRHCIIIVDIQQCYTFVKTLPIENTDVIFIQSKLHKPKNPFNWFLEWENLRNIKKKILDAIIDVKIIFFSSFFDRITCYCITRLKSKNKVFLSIPIEETFKPTQRRILDFGYSVLYGVRFDTFYYINKKVTGLPLTYIKQNVKQDIQVKNSELFAARKKFSKHLSGNEQFILLLDAECNYDGLINSDNSVIHTLFGLLTKFNVLVKGHPRLGLSSFSLNAKFSQIDSYIPVEFIDFSICCCVVGSWSIALANTATMGVKSISLLKLLPYADENLRQARINYLEQYAPSKMLYPTTLEELENELISSFQ